MARWLWVALALQFAVSPRTHGQTELKLHDTIERQFAPGRTDEYTISVAAGQFVRVVAWQMGVDVVVTVVSPVHEILLQANRLNGAFGPEAASFIGEIPGTYSIQVSSVAGLSGGRYRMEFQEARAPVEADGSRIEAERAEFEAGRASQVGTRAAGLHALELFERANSIWRSLGDTYEEGLGSYAIGLTYFGLGDKQKALDNYGQALRLTRAAGDQSDEASTLNNMGTVRVALGERRKALDYFQQALPLRRAVGDQPREAYTLQNIGLVYAALGEKNKALESFGQALALFRAGGDQFREAVVLINAGNIYSAIGERQKALDYFGQALPLTRASGNKLGEGNALNSIGLVYDALGEKQKALDALDLALERIRAAGDRNGEGTTLNNIGLVYTALGENRKALDYFGRALAIHTAAGDRDGEATTLNNIGFVYSNLGQKQKALEYFDRALPIFRDGGNRSGEATTLNNFGLVYASLGDRQKALDNCGRALPIFRESGDRDGEARSLHNIGAVYAALGEHRKALGYYQQALPIWLAVGDRYGQARSLVNIGLAYAGLDEDQKALEYFRQALPISRAVGDRDGEAATLDDIGQVFFDHGEEGNALDYYRQALPIFRAVGHRDGEAGALWNISEIFEKSRPELAIVLAKQAVNLLQTVRQDNRGLEESLRKSLDELVGTVYRYLAGLLVDQKRFGEAEEVLNLLKDKETDVFIRRDAVSDRLKEVTLLDSEREALARYEQIQARIVPEGQDKAALVETATKQALSAEEVERSRQLDGDLAAANTVLQKFLEEQEKTFAPDSATAKRMVELRESEGLQDALQALGPDVVAIYTLVLPDRYTALLVTSGARKAYSTAIPEAELNRKVFEFRQQLQNPASNPVPRAQELYRILFPEGLRQDLDRMGAKTILWSIDSTIRYVPMAALHDGEHYLITRFRNSLITPASLARLTESSRTLWKGVGFGVSAANGGFSALPAVPEELRRIFRQGDGGDAPVPGRVELDGQLTRAAFQAALLQPEKSVVHIATHFDSRPGVAANSHLLLGDGTELSLAEIEATPRLFSGVDLLTLSACSTAFTNSREDGREVDSFGTIAQRLGARSVIASLWNVNDQATARLMEAMYRIRQSAPELGKSEALRQAQEQMASGVLKPEAGDAKDRGGRVPGARVGGAAGWTHPYYWAPFILIGNGK
jgi:tetratricopeptide (TPR) repeat protein